MPRVTVFTCVFGDYDRLTAPKYPGRYVRASRTASRRRRRWRAGSAFWATRTSPCTGIPERDCIYDEVAVGVATDRAPAGVLARQARAYEEAGYPRRRGLYECGIPLRRNTARVRAVGNAWWEHVQTFSARDQVSFPVVCWQTGFVPKIIPGRAQDNEWFRWRPHGV